MRHTGIPIIGDVPWGTHFCQFYQDKQDLIDILVPYFKAGLENNEFCMWVTSEPLGAEEAKAALARDVEGLERYIRDGQIEILDYGEWYTVGGKFESDRVLQGWVERVESAQARGFDGLRLTGNTFWLEKSDWQDFTEYEATVDGVIGQYRMLAVCTYSLARCGAVEIMDVVSNHAFALIKRAGKWQIVESAERKRIEASLRESEEAHFHLAAIVESSTDAVIGKDLDGNILTWNVGAESMYGYSSREALGRHISLIGPPELHDEFSSLMQRVRRGELIQDHETVRVKKDGSRIDVAFTLSPIRDRAGTIIGFSSIARDVTGRKQAEEALRQQREWLRVTLTSIGDAVLATDTGGTTTFLNPVAAELTGWTEEQALGRPLQDVFRIINEQTRKEAEDIVGRVLREGRVVSLANHTALVTRDGREIPIEDSAAPIHDRAGNVAGAVLVFHDVTAKRGAQEAMRDSEKQFRTLANAIPQLCWGARHRSGG